MQKEYPNLNKIINSIPIIILLGLVVCLNGCISPIPISPIVLTIRTGYNTYQGSNTRQVIVVPKKEEITSIESVTVSLNNLKKEDIPEDTNPKTLKELIIEMLRKDHLYQSEKTGYDLFIQLKTIEDGFFDKTISAFVFIKNNKSAITASKAYFVSAEGLRGIDHIKEVFAESVVKYIKEPIKKEVKTSNVNE